ncbi:transmembrane protein, putative [Medicago truncatula]|uniref:Transmembrane protein, putative n=1 Tax=Medicago truncatula TaxID=3880 RepID=G7JQE1_MEDTR|nr:transmembrane protein, putative [Medicago truncatula]
MCHGFSFVFAGFVDWFVIFLKKTIVLAWLKSHKINSDVVENVADEGVEPKPAKIEASDEASSVDVGSGVASGDVKLTVDVKFKVKIPFQEQIFQRLSLGAKERRFGADSGQKYEDLVQKYEANHQGKSYGA